MRVFNRYLTTSFLKILGVTVALLSFILLLFDVFSNLDIYIQNQLALPQILWATLLFLPEAIIFALPASTLFASTYILSMFHANNEMIILKNSGFSFYRIILPLILIGVCLSLAQFIFSESIGRTAQREKELYNQRLLSIDYTQDNKDITLYSEDRLYVMHAKRYNSEQQKLSSVTLFKFSAQGDLLLRLDSATAQYEEGRWTFNDVNFYSITDEKVNVKSSGQETFIDIKIPINLFENRSNEISSMTLQSALSYVDRAKRSGSAEYSAVAADVFNRIFNNLAPFILLLISCSTVFQWKKNILLLSILTSISIAVVFYVLQLIGMILAKQQIIEPIYGTLGPMLLLLIGSVSSLMLQRK